MASSASGLRERRATETESRLAGTARRWTAERGIAGFTVEELCDAVGVSRRTFFNYFASKDDAVLGLPVHGRRSADNEAEQHFLASAGHRGSDGLSLDLLDDLSELLIQRWEALDVTAHTAHDFFAAFEREPRLLGRVLQLSHEQELGDAVLVERREGLPPGDLRAAIVVQVLGTLLRASVEELVTDPRSEPLRTGFARRLAAARSVFSA